MRVPFFCQMIASFPPLVWEAPRLLLLGSMPGIQSLQREQYYAHPQNQFWRLLAAALEQDLPVTYEEKRHLLRRNGIALWDVLAHCDREGSLDSNIKNAVPNDIPGFLNRFPSVSKIGFNGQQSFKYFERSFGAQINLPVAVLPSTSPAYTIPFAQKLEPWKTFLR